MAVLQDTINKYEIMSKHIQVLKILHSDKTDITSHCRFYTPP